jgi:Zn-dependent protease
MDPYPIPQQRPPPPPPRPPKKSIFQSIGGGFAAIGVAALKYGFLAIKSLKTSLSLILMIWAYSWLFGWPFAIMLVFLILVHELGHVAAAMMLGVRTSLPMFVPFIGAYVARGPTQDAWTAALIASGGPIAGTIIGWICLLLGLQYQANFLIAAASVSFVINIFNLIPVPPFDGGTMCAAISRWFWFLGLIILGLALIYFHSFYTSIFIIVIVFFMTLPQMQRTFFQEGSDEMEEYYNTHLSNRLIMAVLYLGILAALLLGYGHASGYLTSVLDKPQT